MNRSLQILLSLMLLLSSAQSLAERAIEPLKARYLQLGASSFDSQRGKRLWQQQHTHPKSGKARSCTDCHGSKLTQSGRHIRTGKVIKPLSPALEPSRFSSSKKVEKWFKRNCKWTLGRPCSPQEKGDILTYIQLESWR